MDKPETDYNYVRYKQLLAEAVDETKRLELIEIMIRENARDRLEAQQTADRIAMTVMTVARVLGPGSRRDVEDMPFRIMLRDRTSLFRREHHRRRPGRSAAPASSPYCRIASARLGASVAVASRRAARLT